MTQTADIVARCTSFCQTCRTDIDQILHTPSVNQWDGVNFERHEELFNFFKLSSGLKVARDQYPKQAVRVRNLIDRLENEIGNHEADVRFGSLSEAAALHQAHRLERERQETEQEFASLGTYSEQLRNATDTLRDYLTLRAIAPYARTFAGRKGSHFDVGYHLFLLVADDECEKGDEKNLTDYFAEAVGIDDRLRAITPAGLPSLAAVVVNRQLQTASKAVAEIKNYIDSVQASLADDIATMKQHKKRLNELAGQSVPAILNGLDDLAHGVCKSILRFHFKVHVLDKLEIVQELFYDLRLFGRTVNHEMLERLRAESKTPGSRLNPETLATDQTVRFFDGIQGLLRVVRMIWNGIAGRPMISQPEFHDRLLTVINTCDRFYGNSQAEVEKLAAFLEEHLAGYAKPFPHDEIFKIMKGTLLLYGGRVEDFIAAFPVGAPDNAAAAALPPGARPGARTLGKLLRKIDLRVDSLTS